MAPRKSGTKAKANMAQPTLSFQHRKPSASSKKGLSSTSSLNRHNSSASLDPAGSDTEVTPENQPSTRSQRRKPASDKKIAPHGALEAAAADTLENKGKRQALDVNDKRWEGVKRAAQVEMGHMKPIHAGPETNDIHHVLRVFDLTSSYGPCVGISRLQRWERAKKWGLNPPEEIKEILLTEQGQDQDDYRENVLHTWLG
ncbi:DNA polymerase delta, subunit 4-domain-containing protein [Papiliotrema laurentii]|uniref:DNA polymerase delta, subunit 4-domain-containing protein n=1 Tax=Papiliotrema laurentii TaxID=5418 RepID=A0AAD9FIT9_PAPLA|nr:DNA polymerase delta, subunit 4-domain-containing protein [Papiliotrema laurentii]